MQATINSVESLQRFIGDVRELYKSHHFLRATIKTGTARSYDQNGTAHCWYEQIARELREDTPLGVKNFCKLHYGVPIMRAEDEDFRQSYDLVIRPLPYEKKLSAMNFWPVTSLMNKDQHNQYFAAMQEGFAGRVLLEFKKK